MSPFIPHRLASKGHPTRVSGEAEFSGPSSKLCGAYKREDATGPRHHHHGELSAYGTLWAIRHSIIGRGTLGCVNPHPDIRPVGSPMASTASARIGIKKVESAFAYYRVPETWNSLYAAGSLSDDLGIPSLIPCFYAPDCQLEGSETLFSRSTSWGVLLTPGGAGMT